MLHQALAEFESCVSLSHGGALYVTSVAEAHARLGNRDVTLKILNQLQSSSDQYVSPSSIAFIYSSLGETDQAFSWQKRAYEERNASLAWVKVAAESDALRSGGLTTANKRWRAEPCLSNALRSSKRS